MQIKDPTIDASRIDSRKSLLEAIEKLEERQRKEILAIKTDMRDAYESLKPANVLRTLVSELFHSPEIRKDLFQSGIGVGAGYLARRLVIGKSHNPFKRLMGYLVQVGVTNIVNSNEEEIESKGKNLIQRLIKRYHHKDEVAEDEPGSAPNILGQREIEGSIDPGSEQAARDNEAFSNEEGTKGE